MLRRTTTTDPSRRRAAPNHGSAKPRTVRVSPHSCSSWLCPACVPALCHLCPGSLLAVSRRVPTPSWHVPAHPRSCSAWLQGACQDEYIEIYDGAPKSSLLLGRICSRSPLMYTSSSNFMSVRFYSDSRYSSGSFRAQYQSFPADQNTS
uniref:CUB domain-containing protein n=1 Tax=Catharus ustulatus TaxID=91951 RepID=A0A8C3U1V8_CATUS